MQHQKLQNKGKKLHFRGEVSLSYREDWALLVAHIVALSVYRFDMKFFWVFPMVSVLHVKKIVLYFGK